MSKADSEADQAIGKAVSKASKAVVDGPIGKTKLKVHTSPKADKEKKIAKNEKAESESKEKKKEMKKAAKEVKETKKKVKDAEKKVKKAIKEKVAK
jgi:hypothetical protein